MSEDTTNFKIAEITFKTEKKKVPLVDSFKSFKQLVSYNFNLNSSFTVFLNHKEIKTEDDYFKVRKSDYPLTGRIELNDDYERIDSIIKDKIEEAFILINSHLNKLFQWKDISRSNLDGINRYIKKKIR